jgi:hypothetical protein
MEAVVVTADGLLGFPDDRVVFPKADRVPGIEEVDHPSFGPGGKLGKKRGFDLADGIAAEKGELGGGGGARLRL